MELAINDEIDRFTLAIEVIIRTPKVQRIGAHAREKYRDLQIDWRNYASSTGSTIRRSLAGDGRTKGDEDHIYLSEFARALYIGVMVSD